MAVRNYFSLPGVRSLLLQRDGARSAELSQTRAAGGMGRLPTRIVPDKTLDTVCGFCSTGCSLRVHIKDGRAVNTTPTPSYGVNRGMACPKGWEFLAPLRSNDRATVPLLRGGNGRLNPVDWQRASSVFVERFAAIQNSYGADSVAFLSTGQIASEEMALLGAVAKFGMGFVHGDGNTRQCMATAAVAYKESFGFDAPPFSYADLEQSDVLVFVGANPCIAHPVLWQRVCNSSDAREVIVVDPRTTETAMAATRHLAVKPKSDLVLLYGIAAELIDKGYVDSSFVSLHTNGFNEFSRFVKTFEPSRVCRQTGLMREQFDRVVEIIGGGRSVSFWWTMGVNQSHEGVRTAQAIINIALMTGNIGRAGTGANSITGQANAMGSRLFSNTTSLLGGREFTNANHRQEVAEILDIDEALIPRRNSLAYDQIIEGIDRGTIKGLWVVATNPAHSWIERSRLSEEVLSKLDFLVVQDMYSNTETAALADLVLPAAGCGEKQGTVINSERRFGLFKKVSAPPGQAKSDFEIFKDLAAAWGCGKLFEDWTDPEAVFEILKKLSRDQPCDISGIEGYEDIEANGGIQWPLPEGTRPLESERRLFADGRFFHDDERARFCFEAPRPHPEPTSEAFPFTLLTGRGTSAQWHTNTRTAKSPVLRSLYAADAYVEINTGDALRLGLKADDKVVVQTPRGTVVVKARPLSSIPAGVLFMPMHYIETNRLTLAAFDPYSRQPAYKACAARVYAG